MTAFALGANTDLVAAKAATITAEAMVVLFFLQLILKSSEKTASNSKNKTFVAVGGSTFGIGEYTTGTGSVQKFLSLYFLKFDLAINW